MHWFGRTKGIELFATQADHRLVITALESRKALKYVWLGLSETPDIFVCTSGLALPNLGISLTGENGLEDNYMVVQSDVEVKVRSIPQRRGGVRYTVEVLDHPTAITFWPGGLFKESCFVSGSVGTASDHPMAVSLYRSFAREVKKRFTRVNADWLGPEALQYFESGMRFTASVRASPLYDLKRP